MAELRQSVSIRLYCFLLVLLGLAGVAPSCSPSEPPILVEPTPDGSLEDALRGLDHLGNCTVRLYLFSGVHVISSGVAVSAASVALSSHPNNTDRPVVRCGDNMPHPGESVNVTEEVGFLTFWKGAREVSISEVDFEGCPRTVQFIEVDRVSIRDCTFRNFTQGPVNMYNCPVVTVSESTFENNHAQSVFTDLPSRVSGGGLSVAIDGRNDSSLMRGAFNYTIQSCTFSNNNASSSVPSAGTFSILEGGHVNGHGGGVAFYMVHSSVVEIKVLGCNFTNNYAPAFGGGLLIFSPETVPEEDFTIADSYFEGNEAEAGGAISLSVTFLQKGKTEALTKNVIYTNNVFVRNKARFGGAMYFGPGLTADPLILKGSFEVSSNVFQENVAEDIGAVLSLPQRAALIFHRTSSVTVFENNTFISNNCIAGGIVSTFNYPVHFKGTNVFANNIGPCLHASEALVEVSGDMLWMGNSVPKIGAAVHLTSHAQLRLHPSANLTFVSNNGLFGSAIVAEQPRTLPFLVQAPYNPHCFLTYSNRSTVPQDQEVSLSFINNTAQVGSALYLQYIEQCSYFGLEESSHPLDRRFRLDMFSYSGNENTGHSYEARGNSSYDISTPVARIELTNTTVSAHANEEFSVGLHGLDELGHSTAGTFGILQTVTEHFVLQPAARHVMPSHPEFETMYSPVDRFTRSNSHNLVVRDFDVRSTASLTLIRESCPAGFEEVQGIVRGRHACLCSKIDTNILSCNTSSEDIMVKDWLWGTPITNSEGVKSLFTTSCCRGYCHCQLWYTDNKTECRFTVSQDLAQRDQQCTCNRQGFLCGSCVSGTGVTSLLNRCEACDTANATLIVLLVFVDAAFFLAILLYSLVSPIHLAAWWYPFLFYIQVASYSTENFPVLFDSLHNAMFYLGSLLGLYFPYDFCLYPNATAVEVYAIKYIPFIVALTVCTAFGVLSRCCIKNPKRKNFSGIWLIAVLLINPAIHTSFSILQCPRVGKEDGRWMNVWRYDGTVECYTEGHLPLAIWAGTVLAIYTLMVVVIPLTTIIWTYCARASKWTKALAEVASYPYAPKFWWWFIVNYARQLLIIFFAVYDPRTRVFTTTLVLLFYFLYLYARPYKSTLVNIIEISLLAYFGLFLIFSRTTEVTLPSTYLDATDVDSCGKVVPTISTEWIVLGVLYFLPVTVLLILVGRWLLCSKVVRLLRERLLARGDGIHEPRPIDNTYPTANWEAVSETTIYFVQHRRNTTENLL